MSALDDYREELARELDRIGLGWLDWPGALRDRRLSPTGRLAGVIVLLATAEGDEDPGTPLTMTLDDFDDPDLDMWGRSREPWVTIARLRLPWTAQAATTAVTMVTAQRTWDERRMGIALRGARQVCTEGSASVALVDALGAAISSMSSRRGFCHQIEEMGRLARRALAAAAPPALLDLSLLAAGDSWAGPACAVAADLPADEVAPLVRLLGELGPRKPSRTWLARVESALEPDSAELLLRRWLELATQAQVVATWPGGRVGDHPGTLFVGTNPDVVRAAIWATTCLPDEDWPTELLGALARRGSAHNGAAGFPEALALKVAGAAVDSLIVRGRDADRRALQRLAVDLNRRDLVKKVESALADGVAS